MEDSDDWNDITNGQQCWYGTEADLGGLRTAMRLEILTELL